MSTHGDRQRAFEITHRIAMEHAMDIIRTCRDAGLDWPDVMVCIEKLASVAVATAARTTPVGVPESLAEELIDALAKRIQRRVKGVLTHTPVQEEEVEATLQ